MSILKLTSSVYKTGNRKKKTRNKRGSNSHVNELWINKLSEEISTNFFFAMVHCFFNRNLCFGYVFLAWLFHYRKCVVTSRLCEGYAVFQKWSEHEQKINFVCLFCIKPFYHVCYFIEEIQRVLWWILLECL